MPIVCQPQFAQHPTQNPLFFHVAADAYLALMVAQGRDNTCPAAGRLNRALPSIPR